MALLALLTMMACGGSAEKPGPSPTPPSGMFSTLPTSEPPVVGDQPPTIELNTPVPTPTSQPTPTPNPTYTPVPTPMPLPTPNPTATPDRYTTTDPQSDRHGLPNGLPHGHGVSYGHCVSLPHGHGVSYGHCVSHGVPHRHGISGRGRWGYAAATGHTGRLCRRRRQHSYTG